MQQVDETDIRTALARIGIPGADDNIVGSGRVQGLVVRDRNVGFSLDVGGLPAEAIEPLKQQAEQAAANVAGVVSVTCVLTAHKQAASTPPDSQKPAANREKPAVFERIGAVIAIASGKGGVGKSTVAVNLAIALHQAGLTTGLLDADIYGPSLPQLLNIADRPDMNENKQLLPMQACGLATMSIGFMVPPEQAMIWRGPMVQSALLQMLNDVAWPSLDVLVIDMPPGTGDIQLTMAQRIPVTGALIVTTPSNLALADVRRALAMFEKTDIPVFGMVENMAYMPLPDGGKAYPFGQSGTDALTKETGLPVLASLPLDAGLGVGNESGIPVLVQDSQDSAAIAPFHALAKAVKSRLDQQRKKK
jgi:ATP-binding protein involved in chromosome partitioning